MTSFFELIHTTYSFMLLFFLMAASEKIVLWAKELLTRRWGIIANDDIFELIVSTLVQWNPGTSAWEIRSLLKPIVNLLPYKNAIEELRKLQIFDVLNPIFEPFDSFHFTWSMPDLQRVFSQINASIIDQRLSSQAKVSTKLSSLSFSDSYLTLSKELSTVHRI